MFFRFLFHDITVWVTKLVPFKAKFINVLFVSICCFYLSSIWWICNPSHFNFTFCLCGETITKGCQRECATNIKCPHRCLETVICSCRGYWELLVYWEVTEFHLGCLACTVSPEANKQWIFYCSKSKWN